MPRGVDRLAPGFSCQPVVADQGAEIPKQHLARRHLVNDGIQPLRQQKLVIRRFALDRNSLVALHQRRIEHDSGQCERRLLERVGLARSKAAHANVRLMIVELPTSRGAIAHASAYDSQGSKRVTRSGSPQ